MSKRTQAGGSQPATRTSKQLKLILSSTVKQNPIFNKHSREEESCKILNFICMHICLQTFRFALTPESKVLFSTYFLYCSNFSSRTYVKHHAFFPDFFFFLEQSSQVLPTAYLHMPLFLHLLSLQLQFESPTGLYLVCNRRYSFQHTI